MEELLKTERKAETLSLAGGETHQAFHFPSAGQSFCLVLRT